MCLRDSSGHRECPAHSLQDLKVLETAGLVEREKEGLWVNYTLSDGDRSPYAASLLGNLKHWLEDDREIRDLLDRSGDLHREDLCRHRE